MSNMQKNLCFTNKKLKTHIERSLLVNISFGWGVYVLANIDGRCFKEAV